MRILHVGWGFLPWRPGGLIAYVEDLMRAQAADGHEVSYFLSGRHYPYVGGPRLKRWRRDGVAMYELINPPIVAGLESGTRNPDLDLAEPRSEAAFRRTVRETRPDVIHIQELSGLPSSLIEISHEEGVPCVMTLQDYGPLCATLRLFDSAGERCMRRDVGTDCVVRNAGAPLDSGPLISLTLQYELSRMWGKLSRRRAVGAPRLAPLLRPLARHATRGEREAAAAAEPNALDAELAGAYQRRRDVNVVRLSTVDRLLAQSPRVAEIYRTLGVSGERLQPIRTTLSHIERLRPRTPSSAPPVLTFTTLNGCASQSKGVRVVVAALRALRAAGAEGSFKLRILGHVQAMARGELLGFRGVELAGLYSANRLDELLDDVDVGIVPSIWEESFGFTGVELIAKGIPLIANPLGGIVEYAREDETAWLNRSCSGEELAELMLRLIREPQLVVDMQRSLIRVRNSLLTPMASHVRAIEDVYRDVASNGARSAPSARETSPASGRS